MTSPDLDRLEVAHAKFNAAKTLATLVPSAFEHRQIGPLRITRDSERSESYYNRVLGLTAASVADLGVAISWIGQVVSPGHVIRADVGHIGEVDDALRKRGLRHRESLLWLAAEPVEPVDGDDLRHDALAATPPVRELTPADLPALRDLLEAHGPISDESWQAKRSYHCTRTFRWFGIFDGLRLMSGATLWMDTDVAVLGSAYTRPSWRGRGCQLALLYHRRAVATTPILVDVEPDSTSHRNCLRAGFTERERREIWEGDARFLLRGT